MDKLYIEPDFFELPVNVLKYIKGTPAILLQYKESLLQKLSVCEQELGGDTTIDAESAFIVITILRQKRTAITNAILQLERKENE